VNKRRAGGLAALALLGTLLTACSTVSTEPDQIALHYADGSFSSKTYDACVPVSTRQNTNSPGDKYYKYPTGQRTFKFNADGDAEKPNFVAVSKDNQQVVFTGVLTFNLNTDCADTDDWKGGVLRKFHENIGRKYGAYMDDDGTLSGGWDNMLRTYMGQPLQQILNNTAQQYAWLALYNDAATRQKVEQEINKKLADAIRAMTGLKETDQPYFENFSLTLQKPDVDEKLKDALASVQVALTQHDAIEQQNTNIADSKVGLKALVDTFGPQGAVAYQVYMTCINSKTTPPPGCPQVLIVPEGSNLNLSPTAKK
jgi:hypothetical protein